MPPTDRTPNTKSAPGYEHVHTVKAYEKIPVHEYKSTKTGLTVVIAEVDGPVVNGYFCLVTEAFDDDGLPHTLEHLIFLGSEDYPYKGVLDLLANRCLASGTNAWTDVDHTCYTMETAGSDGFLTLLPIYLDHILYPTLTDKGFVTEVHHITGEGEDAGIVYSEMQGRENSAESRLHLTMARKIYPGKCGYSAETGGIMKNLRETCNNKKVRDYHKEFYRPENLKLIITGQVQADRVFAALSKVEDKILSKGSRGDFKRPWQSPVPPFNTSEDLIVKYPADEEDNGMYGVAWRGPSAVHQQYLLTGTSMLMKYMCALAISPLQKEFVDCPDPYASKVSFNMSENSETCLYFLFQNVPVAKLPLVKPKLEKVLAELAKNDDIDMAELKNIINRHIQECLSDMESHPHHTVAFMIIGHMLYGHTKEHLQQRINPLESLKNLLSEPKSFWVDLLKKYFVDNPQLSIQGVPSIEEQKHMAAEEKARVEKQIKDLGPDGLKEKDKTLSDAIAFNEREAPFEMLQSVAIPNMNSISFHNVERFSSDSTDKSKIDLSNTPVFTYFDHVKTNFVYMFASMDTSKVPPKLRVYLPILLETIFESSIKRDGVVIPRVEVISQLNVDVVSSTGMLGLGAGKASSFKCGLFATSAIVMLQVEASKFAKGVQWLREIIYETIFEVHVLKIIANKMLNNVSQAKRHGRNVVGYAMKALTCIENSNIHANGIFRQQAFLTKLIEDLDKDGADVIGTFELVREIISATGNMALYCAANLDVVKNAEEALQDILPKRIPRAKPLRKMNVTPDYTLQIPDLLKNSAPNCIIGMGCLESSFFVQATQGINSYDDPDIPAVALYIQYLVQSEGPLWKQVRGKGLSYGYTISMKINEGLLYIIFAKSVNVLGAYKESHEIVTKQLEGKQWDINLLESAKSSLVFELIDEEKTVGSVISLSLCSHFQGLDYTYNRQLLKRIEKVTVEDLNRVGEKYVRKLFDPAMVKTAIVCDPTKAEEIKSGFAKMGHNLIVFNSLEESFLRTSAK